MRCSFTEEPFERLLLGDAEHCFDVHNEDGDLADKKLFVAFVRMGEMNFTVLNYAGDLLGGMRLGVRASGQPLKVRAGLQRPWPWLLLELGGPWQLRQGLGPELREPAAARSTRRPWLYTVASRF